MNEKDVPMIELHKAETMMMHMSKMCRNMTIGFIVGFVAMVIMAYIFVTGYTSRTKDWLNTYAMLRGNAAVTEVANETIQQQSPP